MVRHRSPRNRKSPPRSKPSSHIVHSGPNRPRVVLKSAKDKHFYHTYRRTPLERKRVPGFTDETPRFEPATAGDSDGDGTSDEMESSEGEDWEDGHTLVSKFMEVDPDGPKTTDDTKVNLVESLKVPFGRSSVSLKQDLMDILVSTLDRIKQAHDGIAGPKGPDRRMREGAHEFLEYTTEFTRQVSKSQSEYEQARTKCQENTVELIKKLKQAYEKQHQSRIDFNARLREKADSMMKDLAAHDAEIDKLEVRYMKRLKALAKFDSTKSLQNFLSML